MFQTPPELSVDDYMARLAAQLKSLPAAVRDEHLQELRQHMEQLIAARAGQPDAVQSALLQMGDAQQVGRRLAGAWQRKQQLSSGAELRLVLSSTEWWAAVFTLAVYCLAVSTTHAGNIFFGVTMSMVQVIVGLVGIPLVTGAITGLFFPKVAVPATLYATSTLVSMVWLPSLFLLLIPPDDGTRYALKAFTIQAVCWLSLSCLAAYGISALRRKEFYRVTWQELKLTRL